MALFNLGTSGKNPASQQPEMPSVPVQQVSSMRQQGLSDSQIIQTLQRDGYKTHQIFDAMNQADLVSGAAMPLDNMPLQPEPLPPQFQATNPSPNIQGQQNISSQQPPQYPPQYQEYPPQPTESSFPSDQLSYEKVEEIAESIIEEKWSDFSRGISKIVEWKEKTELRINEMDTKITQLKQSFDELTRLLLGKMSEYDKNIISVGSDIKAMDKVFQQMLPSFTENVNELSRITRNIKSKNS